ncbi:hypothetical protein GCM10023193_67780 [Planotetraspora kaengkrachanensis]|uniref:Uncharacterized protein n=2 Tax=Planotetraspora kaengkrachanensis TaxID=575193 RepID=A0A8J3M7G6_9ACTN|nr:hypothetical protein Pka01_40020 [Planotetraspora kaengkrachanensis]
MPRPFSPLVNRFRPIRRTTVTVLTTLVLSTLALTGCTGPAEPPSLPPAGVYDHGPANEDSSAKPAPTDGPAGAVTQPLRAAGWFCAQVRANADGRALWCRIARRDEADMVHAQTAEFLLDHDDRLAWAWFPPPQPSVDDEGWDQVPAAAAPALAAIWPDARDRVRQEIGDFDRDLQDHKGPFKDGLPRVDWQDEHADYDYSSIDGLIVTARDASVRRWPFGGEHYATTMSSAVGDLRAGGYDCFYPPQQSCNRPQSNGYFRVGLRGDQIVSAQFGIGSLIESGRQKHPLSQEFPHGLTFLTDAVRGPVTERIEQSRKTGTSFAGIVAGTIVIIDASRGAVHDDDLVAYFDIQIGVSLTATHGWLPQS